MSEAAVIDKSDAEIAGPIRQGDREQFRELVERHATQVSGIAWAIWGTVRFRGKM